MSTKPLTKLPTKLADEFDTYFQTSRFCQANFLPFNKDLMLRRLRERAARHGFTLDTGNDAKGFKGVFKLLRETKRTKRELRVSAKTGGKAEVWQ